MLVILQHKADIVEKKLLQLLKLILQFKQENNKTHYKVGAKVRKIIKELGGIMPEDLPTPKKSLKELKKEKSKKLKDRNF